jgi:hypothetical protein
MDFHLLLCSLPLNPLYQYLAKFEEFKEVLKLSPDEVVKNIEEDENPWEVEQI